MSRFLVTGGAGFIGSHIAETLAKGKNFVRVMDNFSSGNKDNLRRIADRIDLMEADIRSPEACIQAAIGIDYVLHHAALKNVAGSLSNPQSYNEVNIQGTQNLLDACLKNKVKLFVFASSSSVYGETRDMPLKEKLLPAPISPYALSKLAGEHYCRIYSRNYGIDTISLRYFNVYGPRQKLDDQYSSVVPKFIDCLLRNDPLPIDGTGRQSRDFVYVKDIAEANLSAIKNSRRLKYKGEVLNIATGGSITILGLANMLNKITGKNIKPVFGPPRPGDMFKTYADLTKAKRILCFAPEVKFADGIKSTVDYFAEKWREIIE